MLNNLCWGALIHRKSKTYLTLLHATFLLRYGVLVPEAGVALRGLFIINPEVRDLYTSVCMHLNVLTFSFWGQNMCVCAQERVLIQYR